VLVCHSPDSDDRKAELLRKGLMFEWLERSERQSIPKGVLRHFVIQKARDWWRGRSKKR
jgi:hypothetical protein